MIRNKEKTILALLLVVVVGGLLVLATGISDLELKEGQPFVLGREGEPPGVSGGSLFDLELGQVWKAAGVIIFWVILPLSILYFIISPEARKEVIRRVISMSLTIFALIILIRQLSIIGGCTPIQTPTTVLPEGRIEPVDFTFITPETPTFRFFGTLFAASLMIAAIWQIIRRLRQERQRQPLVRIAEEAETAIREINAGGDLKNTIIRCYAEMNQALYEYKGINRKESMTPREFEQSLGAIGVSKTNIAQLTRLFEDVRYGGKELGVRGGQEAVDCLRAIVTDCKRNV